MNNITLLQGNCLELMKDIPDKSIDMIFTDLPYGTTQNKFDIRIDLDKLWNQFRRIIKDNGCIALWAQAPFNHILAMSNIKQYRYEWIIEKTRGTGHLNSKKMPMKTHENVLVFGDVGNFEEQPETLQIFYKKLPLYNPQMTHNHTRKVSTAKHKRNSKKTTNYGEFEFTTYDSTDRYPRDVLKFKWDTQKSSLHPNQKPVSACEYFINTYTNVGDVVLDCCMGSGTTGVACKNLNRRFIGIELDENYFEIAKKRIFNGKN